MQRSCAALLNGSFATGCFGNGANRRSRASRVAGVARAAGSGAIAGSSGSAGSAGTSGGGTSAGGSSSGAGGSSAGSAGSGTGGSSAGNGGSSSGGASSSAGAGGSGGASDTVKTTCTANGDCIVNDVPKNIKAAYEGICNGNGGVAADSCATANLVGCCTLSSGEQCFYKDAKEPITQDNCVKMSGTWSATQ